MQRNRSLAIRASEEDLKDPSKPLINVIEKAGRVDSPEHLSEILLVEDDPCVREVTREMLACEGWKVREAADAVEAIDLLTQFHASIRLIILDLLTPGLVSGVALAERFAHEYPGIAILLVSGRYLPSTFHSEENQTSWNFLAKPYVPTDFVHSVRTLLAR